MVSWVDRLTRFYWCEYCNEEFMSEEAASVCEEKCSQNTELVKALNQKYQDVYEANDSSFPIELRCAKCGQMQIASGSYGPSKYATSIICEKCRPDDDQESCNQPYGV